MRSFRKYLERRRVLRLLAELERSLGAKQGASTPYARLQPGVQRQALAPQQHDRRQAEAWRQRA
jgi:hypothetical protein